MILSRKELLAALRAASGIVPSRTTRPVLKEALLEVVAGTIRLRATDGYRGVDLPVTGDAQPAERFLLPVDQATGALSSVAAEKVDVRAVEPQVVALAADRDRWKWTTSEVGDATMHAGPTAEHPLVAVVAGPAFAEALERVAWACGEPEASTSWQFHCVEVAVAGAECRLRATTGQIGAEARCPASEGADGARVLLDAKAGRAVLAALGAAPRVEIRMADERLELRAGAARAWALGNQDNFPRMDGMFDPSATSPMLEVDAAALRSAAARAASATSKDTRGIDLRLEMGALTLEHSNPSGAAFTGTVAAKSESMKAECLASGGYLQAALAGLGGPCSVWFPTRAMGAMHFRSPERPGWTALVMTMTAGGR